MKKLLKVLLIFFVATFSLTGCKKEETKATTPATILADSFIENIKSEKDLAVVAQNLSKNDIIKTKMTVEEKIVGDYLSGFDNEIKGFTKAYVIQPVINSIPFIMYVFETDDPSTLEKELKENANPRWNICVEADETITKTVDNYVFFAMTPDTFEE